MQIIPTIIPDVKVIIPDVYEDSRGYFMESYNQEKYTELFGEAQYFVQDNESCSSKGVVRGLHWQAYPYAQGKLVRVIKGAVLDIVVDIRKGSPTFGKYVSQLLSEENKYQFWVPVGFAHSFVTFDDDTIFSYKCTAPYNKESERGLLFTDPQLGIELPEYFDNVELKFSDKDLLHPTLDKIEPFDIISTNVKINKYKNTR